MLAAAPHFEHRLPEVFAGFSRQLTSVPVAFPTASRPQAWAAGAALLLLTTLLELEPDDLEAHAEIPGHVGHVVLRRQPRRSGAGSLLAPSSA